MINLITGSPGAGKTLYMLTLVKDMAEKEGRPVYYHGVNGLNIPDWIQLDKAEDWHKCPVGSIIVMDEAQQTFRTRSVGSQVPEHVAAFETHRHRGHDVFMTTQHPMLIDSNLRRLVGNHKHVVRKFGMAVATVHEWHSVKEQADKSRDDSIRHEFKYPKESYALYKSAEIHTVKRNIPMRVWVLLVLPFIIVAVVWYVVVRLKDFAKPAEVTPATIGQGVAKGGSGLMPSVPSYRAESAEKAPKSAVAYIGEREPRIAGLAFTAPVYDEITKPVRAPTPSACVASDSRCQCYTDQGTKLNVEDAICRGIAAGGYYQEFDNKPIQTASRGSSYQTPQPLQSAPVIPAK